MMSHRTKVAFISAIVFLLVGPVLMWAFYEPVEDFSNASKSFVFEIGDGMFVAGVFLLMFGICLVVYDGLKRQQLPPSIGNVTEVQSGAISLRTKIAVASAIVSMVGGPLVSHWLRAPEPPPGEWPPITYCYFGPDMGGIVFLCGLMLFFFAIGSAVYDRRRPKQELNLSIHPR